MLSVDEDELMLKCCEDVHTEAAFTLQEISSGLALVN